MTATTTISILMGLILGSLALIHILWAIRGIRADSIALPEVDGEPAFLPGKAMTLAVAAMLGLAACIALTQGGVLWWSVPSSWTRVGCGAMGVIFLLRSIGDLRLVGFFKRVKGTRFAKWDSILFSPLCLALGIGALWLVFAC